MTSWHPKVRSRDLDTDVIMIPLANLFVPGVLVPMSSKRLFGVDIGRALLVGRGGGAPF